MAIQQPAFSAALPLAGSARAQTLKTTRARPRQHARQHRARMCAPAPTATDAKAVDHDRDFGRLRHANPAQRQAAAGSLADSATPEIVARLISLLGESDTAYRRAAVQALGMCGEGGDAVKSVAVEMMRTTDCTTRASCAKALAASALHHPALRAHFDSGAVDALAELATGGDPVARIAAVGALATLGSDAGAGKAGCDLAYNRLAEMLAGELDAACGAVAVGAVAQIAQNAAEERREDALGRLRLLADGVGEDDDESGMGYVREMARSHVEQLESGSKEMAKS